MVYGGFQPSPYAVCNRFREINLSRNPQLLAISLEGRAVHLADPLRVCPAFDRGLQLDTDHHARSQIPTDQTQ